MTPDAPNLLQLFQAFDFDTVSLTLAILIAIWVLVLLVHRGASGAVLSAPSYRPTILKLQTLLTFGLYIVGGVLVVFVLVRPSREVAVAMGGSLAVMFALAFKDVAASVLSGLLLLFDRPFQVGDRVQFGDYYGDIMTIGLRVVRLRTLGDSIVTIPNSMFLSSAVSSGNYGELDMLVECDFFVSLEADIAKARDILYEVSVTSRFAYLRKPVAIVISEEVVAEMIVVRLKSKLYVQDCLYEVPLRSDITVRTAQAYAEAGITRPQCRSHQ